MSTKLEYDLSQEIPEAEWNFYGSEFSKRSPKLTCIQIQWDGLVGTLDGTIELEVTNQVTKLDGEEDEFVTKIPIKDSQGNEYSLNSASNKSDCIQGKISFPHAAWRLKVDKGGITGGILKALMIEPSE